MDRMRTWALALGLVVPVVLLATTTGCTSPPPGPPLPAGISPAPAGTPAASIAGIMGDGYVESEHFFTGTATSYRPAATGAWGSDGRWDKVVDQADQPFSTRFVVERPADPARFNGTVWVEWLNVTAGSDAAASIVQARDQVVASGAAWVGVSAQATGVNSLRSADPARYASLDVASDAYSYDIFGQVGEALRSHPALFGGAGTEPQRLIAVGDSQSALRLTTYVNAFADDLVYDGFVIHSRFTSGAPINDESLIIGSFPTRIRTDVGAPVLQLQTEAEVALDLEWLQPGLGTWEAMRQPNAGNVHTWEVAGASHADKYLLTSAGGGTDLSGLFAAACLVPSINDFPFHYAANAAFAATERWVASGERPAATPPITTIDGEIQRDADGNALGGLRLPAIDEAVARYEGGTNPNILCALFGSSTPLARTTLRSRYGTTAGYVSAYTPLADAAVAAGIMTPADRDAAVAAAGSVRI